MLSERVIRGLMAVKYGQSVSVLYTKKRFDTLFKRNRFSVFKFYCHFTRYRAFVFIAGLTARRRANFMAA